MKVGRLAWIAVVAAVLALPLAACTRRMRRLPAPCGTTPGGVLPGVTVTATSEAQGTTFVGVTDEAGLYRIPVRAGVYRITAELSGFATPPGPAWSCWSGGR